MGPENSTFSQFKIYVEELIPLERDYLHILVGAVLLAVYLLWKMVRRRQFRGYEVVSIVLFVAVVAELMDIRDDLKEQMHPDLMESLKDAVLTVSVPAVAALGQLIIQQAIRFGQRFKR